MNLNIFSLVFRLFSANSSRFFIARVANTAHPILKEKLQNRVYSKKLAWKRGSFVFVVFWRVCIFFIFQHYFGIISIKVCIFITFQDTLSWKNLKPTKNLEIWLQLMKSFIIAHPRKQTNIQLQFSMLFVLLWCILCELYIWTLSICIK